MTNVVLLGGTGYIGREITRAWLKRDPQVSFFIISRNNVNNFNNRQIQVIQADLSNTAQMIGQLPKKVDYIIDLIGRPEKNKKELIDINVKPAQMMLQLARHYQVSAMGIIGGKLGPKSFTDIKSEIIEMLQASEIRLSVVEPTIVYGGGRKDNITKMVPILKFMSKFSKKFKPIKVSVLANQLIDDLVRLP
ncbi:NAD-dependent epimerase/dehydratase family protein [Weissella diestrammenae]|uniref:NAD-dependent epimerase/dehydratase family protein n=1 Tax=Weissella diestrammenae TaxID=1162633 RepID=A0A7G9T596_9LACO|nr:NAD-dependent epimerase/dehydratase family protein [Weissella diestrammenae]MCM0583128.1 NAD-dependent epimerase/dehydratase family protein [Weissella diestrammenae]QNN75271.1 NAD-dependent epimerase/dehydratase family protein [Weissella diestrammenae]